MGLETALVNYLGGLTVTQGRLGLRDVGRAAAVTVMAP